MAKDTPWRFSETRPIRPFRVSEHALDMTQLRLYDDGPSVAQRPWKIVCEPEEIVGDRFHPHFTFVVDKDRVNSETGIDPADLAMSLVIRDPALLRSERIAAWPLEEAPATYKVPSEDLQSIGGWRGLQFVLQLSPLRPLNRMSGRAYLPAHVVASHSFEVGVPTDGSDFPVELVDPSAFESRGLPGETVWAIDWRSEDFDQPAEEVLVVLINKERAEKLLRLSASDSVGAVLWQQIAIDVFLEICTVVLRSGPSLPQGDESLLGRISTRLQGETGLDLDRLIAKAREPLESTSYFRAHIQKAFGLEDKISQMNLAGRG